MQILASQFSKVGYNPPLKMIYRSLKTIYRSLKNCWKNCSESGLIGLIHIYKKRSFSLTWIFFSLLVVAFLSSEHHILEVSRVLEDSRAYWMILLVMNMNILWTLDSSPPISGFHNSHGYLMFLYFKTLRLLCAKLGHFLGKGYWWFLK